MPKRPASYRPPNPGRRPDDRPSAAARGYDAAWQDARLGYLAEHPLCVRCEEKGLVVESTTVDHVIPHKGDRSLFWDKSNWQALCKPCHDHKTATEDGAFGRATAIPPAPENDP